MVVTKCKTMIKFLAFLLKTVVDVMVGPIRVPEHHWNPDMSTGQLCFLLGEPAEVFLTTVHVYF